MFNDQVLEGLVALDDHFFDFLFDVMFAFRAFVAVASTAGSFTLLPRLRMVVQLAGVFKQVNQPLDVRSCAPVIVFI